MREVPILFSSEMVRAIIAGRKTQTRRSCKDNSDTLVGYEYVTNSPTYPEMWKGKKSERFTGWVAKFNNIPIAMPRNCPYGVIGDILFVREKWRLSGWNFEDSEARIEYSDGEKITWELDTDGKFDQKKYDWLVKEYEKLVYSEIVVPEDAENDTGDDDIPMKFTSKKHPYSPSIHLPKWCSRIWLEVTDIKVERLQDISPHDASDEGVEYWNVDKDAFEGGELVADYKNYMWRDDEEYKDYHFPHYANPVKSFFSLWEKINGKESLEENPWVWVVSFKVISTTGKPKQ
jgi:hypothetical protein